jgi:hypothetical protein
MALPGKIQSFCEQPKINPTRRNPKNKLDLKLKLKMFLLYSSSSIKFNECMLILQKRIKNLQIMIKNALRIPQYQPYILLNSNLRNQIICKTLFKRVDMMGNHVLRRMLRRSKNLLGEGVITNPSLGNRIKINIQR